MAFDYAAKIQALIANAEDESLADAARATYRAKAEQLMRDYRIKEEEAIATDPGSAEPVWINIEVCSVHSTLAGWHVQALREIIEHAGCRARFSYDNTQYMARVVGYDGDTRYAEYLWTAARLMFSTRIDPVWDVTLSQDENIFRLRNAGMERKRIADRAWGVGAGRDAKNRSRVQRIYLRECAARGVEARAVGLGFQADVYREAYAREFVWTLGHRLQKARDAANSVGGGVVLHGRQERVYEAFYVCFPQDRPKPVDPNAMPEPYTPCEKCAKAKDGQCRDHRITAKDRADMHRRYNSPSARAGGANGTDAARSVHLGRDETVQAQRVGRKVREIGG